MESHRHNSSSSHNSTHIFSQPYTCPTPDSMDILSHTQLELPRYICEGHKRCNQRYNQSHNYAHRDKMKSTGFCTWSKQLSYIQTQSHKCWGHTNTTTATIRHNHKHETHTHTIPHSPQQQLTQTHTGSHSHKNTGSHS